MVVELRALRLAAEGINHEFEFGRKTTLNVLDAERDVNDAEIRRVDAEHGALMAAFRLRAASGTLTVESFGLEGVFGPLEEMQPVQPRFNRWIPLEVEWPDEEKTGAIELPGESELDLALPETAAPSEPEAAPLDSTDVVAASLPPSPEDSGGIVWNIQTTPE